MSLRRLLLLVACTAVLAACRLDVTVAVEIQPDGTGVVAVRAVADRELIEQVPNLAEDLRLEDAIANGWTVEGPAPTAEGGLVVTLTHDVHSDEELANVLNSIGPPLTRMAAARTTEDDQTTNAINGELVLADGYRSFADADLIEAVGGLPFGDELAAAGLDPASAMSFTFRVELPGELVQTTGTEIEPDVFEWVAPLDGTAVNLLTQTVQRPAGDGNWAGPVSAVALVALVVWVVVAIAFVAFVALARRRRRARRERALRGLR